MPTLTITTTVAQANRVASAFGKALGLGRDATEAEVKQEVIRLMRSVVIARERQDAISQITDTPFDPS
jgi:hypothetical protein